MGRPSKHVARTPPRARQIPWQTEIHGDLLEDPYHWLREKDTPEVLSYLEAENAFTDSVMLSARELQESLYREMLSRVQEEDTSVPYRQGGYWYYDRTEKGKQYPIYCRTRNLQDAPEQVLLDLNEFEGHGGALSLGTFEVSDDDRLMAYTIDWTGAKEYRLHIKDLETGRLLPDTIENADYLVWASDSRTLLFTSEDRAKRPYRLNRYEIGSDRSHVVFEEEDELFSIWVERSRDKHYIFLISASVIASETWTIPSQSPVDAPTRLLPREDDHEYYVHHHHGSFYIRTNWEAQNFKVIRTPVDDLSKERWEEVLAHRETVVLEELDFFAHHAVIWERENGIPHLSVMDLPSREVHRLAFQEPIYSISGNYNPEFDTRVFRFEYESMVTPKSVFEYDTRSRKSRLLKQTEVRGGYDPNEYRCERIHARGDGVDIPLSLVYKKGLKRDDGNPFLLYAYGAYGIAQEAAFSSSILSLLDRGFIYGIAHVRGGGELGRDWHDQGRMTEKRNTFHDFIAASEHLIQSGYTRADLLVIEGMSAGGLMVGAVLNDRPELFRIAIMDVPFVDVIHTMLDPSLPLTVGEYLEWGNPAEESHYRIMKSYCPYFNLGPRHYPDMLVRAAFHDTQVMVWEPAKYVARLRALKTDDNLLVLKTSMQAGHSGKAGRYDAIDEQAFDFAFIVRQLGIE